MIAQHPGISEFQLYAEGKLPVACDDAPSVFFIGGAEVGLFKIEWDQFTNEELRDGFYQWMKKHRPQQLHGPDGRGQKLITWRVALEQLGILRLLHRFTVQELQVIHPNAWSIYARPNRRWRKDTVAASSRLHHLFPFLSDTDVPISWPLKTA